MKLIPLTKGFFAKVDDEDYERLSQFKWQVNNPSKSKHITYAKRTDRTNGSRSVSMHREIMRPPQNMDVDHIDGNGLNNQRCNLRLASPAQTCQNRKNIKHGNPYKGVCLLKKNNKYQSTIRINGKRTYLGSFPDAREAAIEYDRAALLHFGQFALTNQQMGVL